MILAIDTTSEFGSIALTHGDKVVEEILLRSPDGFGHILHDQIDRLLQRNGIKIGGLDYFAAASGPGSFTGVRVGLAAAKGFAEATGKGVVAVSNLRAMARFGTSALRATVMDARRGEVYGALYDDRLQIVAGETVMKFPDWVATLPASFEFVALDFEPFRAHANPAIPVVTAPRALAAAIGVIAAAESPSDPAASDANYVRRSDAELLWKE